jgi:hypothetical protein
MPVRERLAVVEDDAKMGLPWARVERWGTPAPPPGLHLARRRG